MKTEVPRPCPCPVDLFAIISLDQAFNEVWIRRFEPQNYDKFAELLVYFILYDLNDLIRKLKHMQVSQKTLKKNEIVAVVLCFLLQLLSNLNTVFNEDRNNTILLKELRFLITILGDTPFQGAHDEIDDFLEELEGVANETGRLVHSIIFASTTDVELELKIIYKIVGVLLQHIEVLKANIIRFLKLLPCMIAPQTCSVDSLFVVDSLLYDLEDLMTREGDRIVDLKDQIKTLHQGLMLSQSLLKEIKAPQNSEIQEREETVKRIRCVAYEAQYLITSSLVGDAPLWYLTIRLADVIRKIELIGIGLQEIKRNFDSGAFKVAEDFSEILSLQANRYSEADGITVGFEDEATTILYHLVGGAHHLQIISIFGMPGLGKTNLAKKLYNHPFVNYHFDKCSWCVVSQTYQRKSLLIEIVSSLASDVDKASFLNLDEESLAELIYKSLKGSRFFIVMDDIWDSNVWSDLRRYLPDDGNGSRILFTSRNKDVAPANSIIYALPSLSNDQCWELLEKKVFHGEPCPPQLRRIGKEIATNCNGLPLAVVVIAGVLSTIDKEESAWRNVCRSLASYILSDQENAVLQILQLSYKLLPEYLKPCFLYFVVFAEDTEILVNKLKWLWIVEGFIHKKENKSIESVAEEYLMELIDKSLVIISKQRSDGGVKSCVVHDLLRDLCLRIAEEENFLKFVGNYSVYEKHQRLVIGQFFGPSAYQKFPAFYYHVRSIFGYPLDLLDVCKMESLRVLDLSRYTLNHVGVIESLVNLRYLVVEQMIELTFSFVNLEVLIVINESGMFRLSSVIQKMVKLRYLSAFGAFFDKDLSSTQTSNLEVLSRIGVKELRVEKMLKCFPHLRKLKCICRPLWDDQLGAYRYPDLIFLTKLESLNMAAIFVWDEIIPLGCREAEINLPCNIRKLALTGLGLPWEKMSIIGALPNLQVLKLTNYAFWGEIWDTRDGEFEQLVFLKLAGLDIAQWNVSSSEHFPKLQRLVLRDCRNLQEIPCGIGEIATLQLIEVELCPRALAESARKIQEEQLDMGNEELRILIGDACG